MLPNILSGRNVVWFNIGLTNGHGCKSPRPAETDPTETKGLQPHALFSNLASFDGLSNWCSALDLTKRLGKTNRLFQNGKGKIFPLDGNPELHVETVERFAISGTLTVACVESSVVEAGSRMLQDGGNTEWAQRCIARTHDFAERSARKELVLLSRGLQFSLQRIFIDSH